MQDESLTCPADLRASVTVQPAPGEPPVTVALELGAGQLLFDRVHRELAAADLPVFLEPSVLSVVRGVLESRADRAADGMLDALFHAESEEEAKALAHDSAAALARAYEANTKEYNTAPVQDEFPKAFHEFALSAASAFFDVLLQLEKSYAQSMAEMIQQRDDALKDLETRHRREAESAVDIDANVLARQREETEMAEATWESALAGTCKSQKQEYRDFVLKLYAEYRLHRSEGVAGAGEGGRNAIPSVPDMVNRVLHKMRTLNRSPSTEMLGVAAGDAENANVEAPPPVSDAAPPTPRSESPTDSKLFTPVDSANAKMIKEVAEMGFDLEHASCALELTGNKMQEAIVLLLENPGRVEAKLKADKSALAAASAAESTQARERTPTSSNNARPLSRSSSFQDGLRMVSRQISQTASAKKPWSFLQQQRGGGLNPPNTTSPMKRVSTWLGKAMENLGLDEGPRVTNAMRRPVGLPLMGHILTRVAEKQVPVQEDAEARFIESFTVSLGSHVRVTHNLRLLATDVQDLFAACRDPARDTAFRAQTASTLYSESLTAVVLLITPKDWPQYYTGKCHKAFFERCRATTEFHFESVREQLDAVRVQLASTNQDMGDVLREGDFFVTQHSNLRLIHLIFHLVVDEEISPKYEINVRSPVFSGLRNVMRLANRLDVTSLSVPLLLLPESAPDPFRQSFPLSSSSPAPSSSSSSTPDSSQLLYRRAELILKCVKGLMMETSRSAKRSHSTESGLSNSEFFSSSNSGAAGGMRTLQFLLPRHVGEREFGGFRTILANVFRAT